MLHVAELTGLRLISLPGLSSISCGQGCLQKQTLEMLPLSLVLISVIFLSSWSEGQREKTHTQGLALQSIPHQPPSSCSAPSRCCQGERGISYQNPPSVTRVSDEDAALKTGSDVNYQHLLWWFEVSHQTYINIPSSTLCSVEGSTTLYIFASEHSMWVEDKDFKEKQR